MLPFARRPIILLSVIALTVAACGGSTDDGSETPSESSTTVALVSEAVATTPTTSTSTTTTSTPTTTTTQPPETTTTIACPPYTHSIEISTSLDGEDVEPGSYKVPWAGPDFVFTASNTTMLFIGYFHGWVGFNPIPYPEWKSAKFRTDALILDEFDFDYFYSYDAESKDKESRVDVPEDPVAWLTEHPSLDASDPMPAVIDGYEGVQVDVTALESTPGFGSNLIIAGYDHSVDTASLPKGARVRFIFFEVEDHPLWWMLTSTQEGFTEATAWSDEILAGIDFC